MKAHQLPEGKNDEWLTPQWLLSPLGAFDLDPCSPVTRPWSTAAMHYTEHDNGLALPWSGRVWLNPPFNRYDRPKWMQKMAEHGNGIMLVPGATETKAFFDHVWNKADAVCFVRSRPHFCFVDGTEASFNCGTAIVLVAYGAANVEALEKASHGVTLRCGANASDQATRQGPPANTQHVE